MNRVDIKRRAREIIEGNLWQILMPFIITSIISVIVYAIFVTPLTSNESNWISIICDVALFPLTIGAYAYVLNFVRKKPCDVKTLFSFYNKFIYIFGLFFLVGLFTTLWTMLLIIPGIVAALSYSMVMYIMIDGTSNPLECIRNSKKMMYGYKWDYFKFTFSFIGWALLAIPTFGLILIYVIPYITVAEILYYEELKKITKFD